MRHIGEVIKMPTGDGGRALGRDGLAAARPYSQDTTFGAPRQGVSIPIFTRDGKRVGIVKGDTFFKLVRASRHLLRLPKPAWSFDLGTVYQAMRIGATRIEVFDCEGGKTYRADIRTLWTEGFHVNRGCGEQVALELSRWQVSGGSEARQIALWEEGDGDGR